jgi:hypothetical protein
MKRLALAAIAALITVAPNASAASVSFTQNGDAISIFLDGGAQNGAFDTIFFQLRPVAPALFTNNNNSRNAAGVPRPAGQAFTYYNGMLDADPLDFPGALGLTQVGLINTPQELSFTVGKLGGTITTADQPDGDLFLANVNLQGSVFFEGRVQLISGGALIQEFVIPRIPEPAGALLALVAAPVLLSAARRKSSCRQVHA